MSLSDRVKVAVSLRETTERAGVEWDRRKSAPSRGDWWAPCPFHGEQTPSFHIVERGGSAGFFKCFGYSAKGTVVDFIMARRGCDAGTAIKMLADDAGVAAEETPEARASREAAAARKRAAQARVDTAIARCLLAAAVNIWREARPAELGDTLDLYLRARGIDVDALGGVPRSLRLATDLPMREQGPGAERRIVHRGAAMVARIGRAEFIGVHRTWIEPDRRARLPDGSKAPKQWLGARGRMMGTPVRLAAPSPRMMAGEGIETTLAALGATRAAGDATWTAEAALSRDALAMAWTPPPGVVGVLVLGEGSSKDPEMAEAKAREAAARVEAAGLRAVVRVPFGRWDVDADFADVAAGAVTPPEDGAE